MSDEVASSLNSLKSVCLRTLDSLLRHILSTSPNNRRESFSPRRLSDPSISCTENSTDVQNNASLLGSIVRCTERITLPIGSKYLRRCESSPALVTLRDVANRLDSCHQQRNDLNNADYQFACALAALLSNVYKILEEDNHSTTDISDIQDRDSMLDSLRTEMIAIRKEHAPPSTTTNEQASLWEELDKLMDVVAALAVERPPQYDEAVRETESNHFDSQEEKSRLDFTVPSDKLPPYNEQEDMAAETSSIANDEKARKDLDSLLNIMERVSSLAPRLNNQRVELTEKQAREMAALAIGKAIERVSGRRLNEQRASLREAEDSYALKNLMQQISQSAERSFVNQRAELNPSSIASKKLAAKTPETPETEYELLNELSNFVDKVTKLSFNSRLNKQRYQLSSAQERAVFINSIVKKVDRLQTFRLQNQDAAPPQKILSEQEATQEMLVILERVQSSRKQFDNQRATLKTYNI
ncbi:hypothetical protein BC943DRAFT_123760 [Umbelopsis sp. AD052]|nr:hypothetical protein BC943DRAFT_123760 [Umbelopsis sp. AD052]